MKTFVIGISLVVFIWVQFAASFQGFDLRKRSGWLYGTFGFLSGFALGVAINGILIEGLNMGAIFAFLTLLSGVTSRWHKQKYGNWATTKSLVRKYAKEDHPSLLAKLVIKLFGKYK